MLTQSHLYREIFEQPDAVERFQALAHDAVQQLAEAITARGIDHVVIAARGTSDNAGRYAKYLLGAYNGLQVALATPSLFSLYNRPIQFGNALVLGISQSGQSPDIVAVLEAARKQGCLTAAITNTPTSPLTAVADHVIALHCGVEQAVAATKTYTTSLAAIAELSVALDEDERRREPLTMIAAAMAATLEMAAPVAEIAPRYRFMQHCVVIGRGFNYGSAFELALKMKELTYTIVEPYSSADFLHGPFAVIEPGFPVIIIAPHGALQNETAQFVERLRQQSAEIIVISDDQALLAKATIALPLPASVPEWLSPLTTILPGQLLSLYLADARQLDVDNPRALSKVTQTK